MSADGPRWLDDDEMRTWLAVVSLYVRLPSALDAQLRRDAGIGHFDYQVLAGLSTVPGWTLRMSELAHFTDASLSRLSHAVARLEDRGWVRRSPDPDDGRVTFATLTDAGMAKLEATAPGHVAEVRRVVFDPLSAEELAALGAVARRIVSAIDPAFADEGALCPRGAGERA